MPRDPAGIHCPNCGYDLRAIPEARCPECGHAYDDASIRWLATDTGIARLGHLRSLSAWCAISIAYSLLSAVSSRETLAFGLVIVMTAPVYMLAMRDRIPINWILAFWLGGFVLIFPPLGRWIAPLPVLVGLLCAPAAPLGLAYVESSLDSALQAQLHRWRIATWTLVALSVAFLIRAWC